MPRNKKSRLFALSTLSSARILRKDSDPYVVLAYIVQKFGMLLPLVRISLQAIGISALHFESFLFLLV